MAHNTSAVSKNIMHITLGFPNCLAYLHTSTELLLQLVWEPGRGLEQSMVDFLGDNQCAVRLMRQSLLTSVLHISEVQLVHLASKIDSLILENK